MTKAAKKQSASLQETFPVLNNENMDNILNMTRFLAFIQNTVTPSLIRVERLNQDKRSSGLLHKPAP
jgi:hypothetical protein